MKCLENIIQVLKNANFFFRVHQVCQLSIKLSGLCLGSKISPLLSLERTKSHHKEQGYVSHSKCQMPRGNEA